MLGAYRAVSAKTKARLEELQEDSPSQERREAIGRVYIWALRADKHEQAEEWYLFAKSMLEQNQYHLVPPPEAPRAPERHELRDRKREEG